MRFRGEYAFLSNMYPCVVVDDLGVTHTSVESAYQASKSDDRLVREYIASKTAKESKALGKRVKMKPGFIQNRVEVMYELVRYKFYHNPKLRDMLLRTGDIEITEDNDWNDVFWGECRGVGFNNLGLILMRVRDELRNDQQR